VTPIHLDLTGRRLLRRLKTWTWDLPAGDVLADAVAAAIPAAAAPTGPVDTVPDD
jgi:hypothetical protein